MIGHRDISMTDRYSHLSSSQKVLLQNQLANHYANGDVFEGHSGTNLVQIPEIPLKKVLRLGVLSA